MPHEKKFRLRQMFYLRNVQGAAKSLGDFSHRLLHRWRNRKGVPNVAHL